MCKCYSVNHFHSFFKDGQYSNSENEESSSEGTRNSEVDEVDEETKKPGENGKPTTKEKNSQQEEDNTSDEEVCRKVCCLHWHKFIAQQLHVGSNVEGYCAHLILLWSLTSQDARNTVGNIPIEWYNEYPHIGYDLQGKRILKPATSDQVLFVQSSSCLAVLMCSDDEVSYSIN